MATAWDMSLDNLIKNRGSHERGRGQGRARCGRGPGRASSGGRLPRAVRRGPLAVQVSYTIAKSIRRTQSFLWKNDLFGESLRAAGISGIESGTRLYVSNLDYKVTNENTTELFSEIGELKRYAVHYDKNGRPTEYLCLGFGKHIVIF